MVIRSNDRVLILEKVNPNDKDFGLIDPKLLTGDNRIRGVMNEQGLWTFKYDKGMLPAPLKDLFTDFNSLKRHAEAYFANKNLRIKEVID